MFLKVLMGIIAILNTVFIFAACKVAGDADKRTEMLLSKMAKSAKGIE